MKATIKFYKFDLQDISEEKEYLKMCEMLESKGIKCFSVFCSKHIAETTDLEENICTKYLFDTQFNTDNERRFDWLEYSITNNKYIKRGYYCELPQEFLDLREKTEKCNYCGALYGPKHANKEGDFCLKCLGSEYLQENDLDLLRITPIKSKEKLKSLTTEEKNYLIPLFNETKKLGAMKRETEKLEAIKNKVKNKIQEAEKKALEIISNAKNEQKGLEWLLDNGFPGIVENTIFYGHTQSFCIGWRTPISIQLADELLEKISEFPAPYEIKVANGKSYKRI